jgi:hypothetical protein
MVKKVVSRSKDWLCREQRQCSVFLTWMYDDWQDCFVLLRRLQGPLLCLEHVSFCVISALSFDVRIKPLDLLFSSWLRSKFQLISLPYILQHVYGLRDYRGVTHKLIINGLFAFFVCVCKIFIRNNFSYEHKYLSYRVRSIRKCSFPQPTICSAR